MKQKVLIFIIIIIIIGIFFIIKVGTDLTVGSTRQIICGDGRCDYGESETCSQDCPKGKESESGPTEETPTLPGMIKEFMKRIGEKLPEATKILVPLIVAIVLIGIVIYVFVI